MNQSRTKRMSRSSTKARTSSALCGWSAHARAGYSQALAQRLSARTAGSSASPLVGEDVLDPHGRVVDHAALDDPLGLELLHPLRQQPVGEVGHEPLELGEASGPVHEDEQDRAGPALAHQLDRLVVGRAAGLPAYDDGPLRRHHGHRKPVPGGRPRPPGRAGSPRCDPSFGTSPARVTRFPKVASATWATRLEDLLVLPAGLARLLVEVALRRAVRLEQRLDEAEQRGLLLVIGVELARERDLVHAEPGVAAGALERRERVLAALVLGDGERDALLGRVRQRAVAELGAEAGVGAEHRPATRP